MSKKTIAILVYNYFEQSEFQEPIAALRKAGNTVQVISSDKKKLQAMKSTNYGSKFTADLLLDDNISARNYAALILPGGVYNADRLRMVDSARTLVLEFLDAGKLVAAICHGSWLLVSADAVEERRLTSYYTIQEDIRNAGGEWVDLPLVVDNNLITSRKPDDLAQFNKAVIGWLAQPNKKS